MPNEFKFKEDFMNASISCARKSLLSVLLFSLLLTLGLQGCSDSNDEAETVIPSFSVANGVFYGSGTVNTDVELADVRGFVHEGRFIFFDEAEAVLYDGNFSSLSDTSLKATVSLYKEGVKVSAANVTGMLVSESSLQLDMSGTGYALGSLTLSYNTELNNRGATMARLAGGGSSDRWIGDAHTPTTTERGNVRLRSANDEADFEISGDTGSPSQCIYNGMKSIPDATKNIYLIDSMGVTQFGFSCDHLGDGYTGFLSVVDGESIDDTLLFAITNGLNANFSIMKKVE